MSLGGGRGRGRLAAGRRFNAVSSGGSFPISDGSDNNAILGGAEQAVSNPYLAHLQPVQKPPALVTIKAEQRVKQTQRTQYPFGNYDAYYGYRTPELRIDPRLAQMEPAWFRDRTVLDIGCNSGYITILVGLLFQPSRIVGIDLDPSLVKKARKRLEFMESTVHPDPTCLILDYFPASLAAIYGTLESDTSRHISFKVRNFQTFPTEPLSVDTILALSVTKWIHINHDDAGIKLFFHKCYRSLKEKGILVLEPQEWESYEKYYRKAARSGVVQDAQTEKNKFRFRPAEFPDFLCKRVGFTRWEYLNVPSEEMDVDGVSEKTVEDEDNSGMEIDLAQNGPIAESESPRKNQGTPGKTKKKGFERPLWVFFK